MTNTTNTAIPTETHLVLADVLNADTPCAVLVTAPWYLEALGCSEIVSMIDPDTDVYRITARGTEYEVRVHIVCGTYDCDGNEVPEMAEATVTIVD